MGQVHVLTGVVRRRRWSEAEKRALVAAAFGPGAVIAAVARRADVSTSLLYRWRKEFGTAGLGFAPVVVSPAAVPTMAELPGMPGPAIEVAVGDGAPGSVRVRIAGSVAPELAAAVIQALRR